MARLKIRKDLMPPKWSHFHKRFQRDVLENHSFNEHITDTARTLNMDREIVLEVMTFYLKFICTILMWVSVNRSTNINIRSWFLITVIKHYPSSEKES